MATEYDIILSEIQKASVKNTDDSDYTMSDWGDDGGTQYNVFTFTNLTADRDLNLPTLADNQGYTFYVVNLSGSFDVACTPEGAELINDWNTTFEITEKYGIVKVIGLSDRWLVKPIGDACIYEVSTEVSDLGLATDGTWDDVAGVSIDMTGIRGCFAVYARARQRVIDSGNPSYLRGHWGLGVTAGNNAPDISNMNDYYDRVGTIANTMYDIMFDKKIVNEEYTINADVTIYMKAAADSDELNLTGHYMYGSTDCPMYIRLIRKY